MMAVFRSGAHRSERRGSMGLCNITFQTTTGGSGQGKETRSQLSVMSALNPVRPQDSVPIIAVAVKAIGFSLLQVSFIGCIRICT